MMRATLAAGVLVALALTGCEPGTAAEHADPKATSPSETSPETRAREAPSPDATPDALPVWWDADGLHHGDVVEETAFPLGKPFYGSFQSQAHLALVRTGALYRSPRTEDVWFHPWGGEPRVVGHGTAAGPAGDPGGDVAAWFDGRHLVVYDTARGTVISRTREVAGVRQTSEYPEHVGHGNGWVFVSADQVVWRSPDGLARRDLVARTSEPRWRPVPSDPPAPRVFHGPPGTQPVTVTESFEDVSATSAVWSMQRSRNGNRAVFIVDRAGDTGSRRLAALEAPAVGRLSPDGSWLLTPELADGTHGVAFIDLDTGQAWKPFERSTYAFFSWAYGDVAVMLTSRGTSAGRTLVACTTTQRTCDQLPTRGDVVLPNP